MTVTVTPVVDTTNWPPRVRLNVTGTTETQTTVNRLNADGTLVPVRTFDGNPLILTGSGGSTTGLVYDYEATFNSAVSFTSAESPTVVSSQVTVPSSTPWLIHPGVPALSMPIVLRPGSLQEEMFGAVQGVFHPMGRVNPVIVTDGARKGSQSSITVILETLNDLAALRALISDAGVLLLNIPADQQYGFSTAYVAISDVRVARLTSISTDPYRDVTLPFYVVDRPAGGSQSQRSYADLLAAYSTYPTLDAAYPNYTAMLAGP